MQAFKFRQLQAEQGDKRVQLERVIDILTNRRLYCSPYNELNDPMEGYFHALAHDRSGFSALKRMIEEITTLQSKYRICSLSSNCKSHLVWAHYANGFRGVAIELDIMKKVNFIEEVEYSDGRDLGEYDPAGNLDDLTRKVLLTKYKEWKYEREIRIIQEGEPGRTTFYALQNPPKAVYFGTNVDPLEREEIVDVCANLGIPTYDMRLLGYKITYRINRESGESSVLPFRAR
ncbi:DUF2971 domain-containing protein [Dinoroseobacter sp. PD6]|uniref:DUF2971 domain-containing protein n=1 Tax=Dinoroseobacter sp. PD6 TaxID=3028384 RepID=UPI00237B913C|nr:DUF2971 domain-containing protein [Dinoroseobacter sp. PD6]MDD9716553.1 DUF2971 domain-containing protein [Dinoroseobacter sp. PD6]